MTLNDIKIIGYKNLSVKRFGYWVEIKNYNRLEGKRGRKEILNFFESFLGPLGIKWQYMKNDDSTFVLKLNDEKDLLLLLLRAKN